jgi:hypothetical protein
MAHAMKLSQLASTALQLAIVLTCATVCAAERQGKSGAPHPNVLPPVEVTALRDPVEKSYRRIVSGMDLFEQRHSLAPEASLRFKLLPRQRDTNMHGITLSIMGETVAIPVPVASDNTFTLERYQRALDEDALVIPNRKARSMTWRTDIRTPGLPPNTRRLGDLRLECLVGMEAGLVSDMRPLFGWIANFRLKAKGYGDNRDFQYLFFAERPLFSVTLVAGVRREVLSVDDLYAGISRDPDAMNNLDYCDCQVLLDRTYYAPLGDASWPDDTRIVLEYMDDDAVSPAAARSPAEAPHGRPR